MKTQQETFDTIATHLLKQRKKAEITCSNDGTICAYRGSDGTKCAAGCLIPDELYTPDAEGLTVVRLMKSTLTTIEPIKAIFAEHDFDLLRELQLVHDDYPFTRWRDELEAVAVVHNLHTDVLKA